MGYLRPDWLTLERDGMSSNSHFPADAAHILEAARNLPEPDWRKHYSQTFVADASYDLLYNLPNVFLWGFSFRITAATRSFIRLPNMPAGSAALSPANGEVREPMRPCVRCYRIACLFRLSAAARKPISTARALAVP